MSTSAVGAFLKLRLTGSFGRPGSIAIGTPTAPASARNTSVGDTSHSANETRGGSSALASLGSGVTRSAPSKRQVHSALSQTAFNAVPSLTLVSVIVTARMAPAPISTLRPAAEASVFSTSAAFASTNAMLTRASSGSAAAECTDIETAMAPLITAARTRLLMITPSHAARR